MVKDLRKGRCDLKSVEPLRRDLANGFFLTFAMVELRLDQKIEPFRRMPSATIRKVLKNG